MLSVKRQLWNKPSKFESQETEHLLLLELSNQDSSNNIYNLEISPFKPQASPERGKITEVILANPELRNIEVNEQRKVIVNKQSIERNFIVFIRVSVFIKHMNDENNGEKEVINLEIKNQQGVSQLKKVFGINYTGSENAAQTFNQEVEAELAQYKQAQNDQNKSIIEEKLETSQPLSINQPSDSSEVGEPIDMLTIKLEELIYSQNGWTPEEVEYIDQEKALNLKTLDLSDPSLTNEDLEGVEQFPNLTKLVVGRNGITELSFINPYQKLEHLTIIGRDLTSCFTRDNEEKPLISLAQFKALRELVLIDAHLSNLEFLKEANLENLKQLTLDHNKITDLEPISEFVGLEYLSASNNQIKSINCLKNLINLKQLILGNNQIGDARHYFRQWKDLKELNLNNNNLTDLRPFRVINTLKVLKISGNPLQSLQHLQGLSKNLEELAIRGITLTDNISEQLTKLPPMQQLETVTVNRKGEEFARNKIGVFVREIPISETVNLPLVSIPAGEYEVEKGDSVEQIMVKDFWMSQTQITQEQWVAVAQLPKIKTDLNPSPSKFQGNQRPVEQVNWHEAQEFCQRLSQETGEEIKLPTEEQWEYACRAGTETPFHFGETLTDKLANYNATSKFAEENPGAYRDQTTDVGSFPPNGFGLYDMHGNVWEWCDSDYDNNNSYKVLRGGSSFNFPSYCRSAARFKYGPGYRYYNIGFRVVVVRRTD